MICAQPDSAGSLVVAASQPADMATCPVVLITGSELSAVTGIAFPAPSDFGEVWAVGFTMVVVSYLIGWGAGAVLRFFR
ncbi:hypothetical protein GmRootV118_24700 [Variovorax sp. V118]